MHEPSLINENDLNKVNSSYNIFSTSYLDLFNKYFPYVRKSGSSYNDKPYITSGMKVSIRTRIKLYHNHLHDKDDEAKESIWRRFWDKT